MISSGVALASKGELRFNLVGFVIQAAAVAVRPVSLLLPVIAADFICLALPLFVSASVSVF